MGSPQNYYGVGFYEGLTGGREPDHRPEPADIEPHRAARSPSSRTGRTAIRATTSTRPGRSARATAGQTQAYGTFGLNVPGTNTISGIEVHVEAKANDPAGLQARRRALEGQRDDMDVDEQDDRPDRQRPGVAVAAPRRLERPVGRDLDAGRLRRRQVPRPSPRLRPGGDHRRDEQQRCTPATTPRRSRSTP